MTPANYPTVTGLVVMCIVDESVSSTRVASFAVSEFLEVNNSDLILLRDGLGWTVEAVNGPLDLNLAQITSNVKNVLLPDEDDKSDDRSPWNFLGRLSRGRGIDVSASQLARLPYKLYFSDDVLQLCG